MPHYYLIITLMGSVFNRFNVPIQVVCSYEHLEIISDIYLENLDTFITIYYMLLESISITATVRLVLLKLLIGYCRILSYV